MNTNELREALAKLNRERSMLADLSWYWDEGMPATATYLEVAFLIHDAAPALLDELDAAKAEIERLTKAWEVQHAEKVREKAEAKLWFDKAQEWKARIAELEAALVDHNDSLRSAKAIADRDGVNTNWLAFRGQVTFTLAEHHEIANTARAALKGDSK